MHNSLNNFLKTGAKLVVIALSITLVGMVIFVISILITLNVLG